LRIVSLLPSATEILFALGLGDQVVGVTFECDHPPEARTKTMVSSTTIPDGLTPGEIDTAVVTTVADGAPLYTLDEGALARLAPDVVVTQDLCAVCAIDVDDVDAALDHLGCRAQVVTLDPRTLADVLGSITQVGRATGRPHRATELVTDLRTRLDAIARAVRGRPAPRVAVLEWTDPPYRSGHWVPEMVEAAGAVSVLGAPGERSVRIRWVDLVAARPEVVVVAPCGYDLETSAELAQELVDARRIPDGVPVWAVDANAAFVRPGPRVVDGVEALAAIAHPGVVPLPSGLAEPVVAFRP
jgi:iron complex transport system substrate-binding protein